ncbi:hypothetical protein [Streptomyces sp. H27-H1]|uniref:hypothetical protein n=1 Tax=Streptomyces sp. H27-H1 TaxID=2996461 RepID=UPI003B63E011
MTIDSMKHHTARLPEHTPRLAWAKLAPEVYQAMVRLDTAAASSSTRRSWPGSSP